MTILLQNKWFIESIENLAIIVYGCHDVDFFIQMIILWAYESNSDEKINNNVVQAGEATQGNIIYLTKYYPI